MHRDAGFTLLETVVAFVILALVLGAAYAAIAGGLRAQTRSDETLANLHRAQSVLAGLGVVDAFETGRTERIEGQHRVAVTTTPIDPTAPAWRAFGQAAYRVSITVSTSGGSSPVTLETLRMGPLP